MAYRQYLTQNASTIIQNNQNNAAGNCSNIIPLSNAVMPSAPILFTSITNNPSIYDNPSDLKDNYLNKYISSAGLFAPAIKYHS